MYIHMDSLDTLRQDVVSIALPLERDWHFSLYFKKEGDCLLWPLVSTSHLSKSYRWRPTSHTRRLWCWRMVISDTFRPVSVKYSHFHFILSARNNVKRQKQRVKTVTSVPGLDAPTAAATWTHPRLLITKPEWMVHIIFLSYESERAENDMKATYYRNSRDDTLY